MGDEMLGILAAALMQAAAPYHASVVTVPDWERRPNARDLAKYFPKDAAKFHVAGHATLECVLLATGVLTNCKSTEERPIGAGFGAAAIGLSTTFRMRPQTKDGAPVNGGHVRIPINFSVPHSVSLPVGVQEVMFEPQWSRTPSVRDVLAAYPKKAREVGVEGEATLLCVVSPSGDLSGCGPVAESPANLGFGPAAVGLSEGFRIPTQTPDGRYIVGAAVFAQIRFQLPR